MTRRSCYISTLIVLIYWTLSPVTAGQFKCFTKDTTITGRTCVTNRSPGALGYPSVSTCASRCISTEGCVSFFYADGICDGCNLVYNGLSSLTPELENSVYYKRTAIDYEHVGCFISCHSPDPCPLGTTMRNADVDADMTPGQCFEYCKQFGLPYFGTETGYTCYCGDENYDMYGSSTNCNENCHGDVNQYCGGHGSLSVYKYIFDC